MKKITIYILLFSFLLFGICEAKYQNLSKLDDCMLVYLESKKEIGYIYKMDDFRYHIDTSDNYPLEKIGYAHGCRMTIKNPKYGFMAITNSFYCSYLTFKI